MAENILGSAHGLDGNVARGCGDFDLWTGDKPAAELPALPSRARPVLHAAHCLARNQPGSTSNTFGQTTMLGVLI